MARKQTGGSRGSSPLYFFCLVSLFLICVLGASYSSGKGGSVSVDSNLRKRAVFPSPPTQMAAGSLRGTSLKMASAGSIPAMIYGTAWKKERTADLVETAVRAGFRAIDTACQPKHYNEPGVGEALERLYKDGVVKRSELFIQTKFTSLRGQDKNSVPYDKHAALDEQVRQSVRVSLRNLNTPYLDSLILHSPMSSIADTMIVWREFESFVDSKQVLKIGVSNCYDLETLRTVHQQARIKPSFLQNRFYRESRFDREIRAFCRENGIVYQSFWTLTASPDIVKSVVVTKLAKKHSATNAQIWFGFIQHRVGTPLSGTQSVEHMQQDLLVPSIHLEENELDDIEALLL